VPADVRRQAAAETVAPDDPDFVRLLMAVRDGEPETVRALVTARPALAIARESEGQTALHLAAQFNDPQIAALLLAYGADLNAKLGQSAHSPLSWAVTCNAIECAQALAKLGADLDLFCAAGIGAMGDVDECFNSAGDLFDGASCTGSSRYDVDGSRLPCPPPTAREQISDALYIACRNAQVEVARLLLTKQPDLSFRAFLGGTPLHWAYFGGSREIVDRLLFAGADATARDKVFKCSPRAFGIVVAANWGFDFKVRKLLATDATLANAIDDHTSPLIEAARGGHIRVVHLLLVSGADANFHDATGKTALHVALECDHAEVTEMLRNAAPR
jgi:ankyrin repeat protein